MLFAYNIKHACTVYINLCLVVPSQTVLIVLMHVCTCTHNVGLATCTHNVGLATCTHNVGLATCTHNVGLATCAHNVGLATCTHNVGLATCTHNVGLATCTHNVGLASIKVRCAMCTYTTQSCSAPSVLAGGQGPSP